MPPPTRITPSEWTTPEPFGDQWVTLDHIAHHQPMTFYDNPERLAPRSILTRKPADETTLEQYHLSRHGRAARNGKRRIIR